MGDISQVSPSDFRQKIRASQADAKNRKESIRHISDPIYDQNRAPYNPPPSAPMSPQDHPANNVSHPSGNRGRLDATVPLNVPQTWPSHTGDYEDAINY